MAAAAKRKLSRRELAQILNIFGQKTARGTEYENPTTLIKIAMDHYADIDDLVTADNITIAFTRV